MRREVRALARAAASPVTTLKVACWAWSAASTLDRTLGPDGIEAVDRVGPPPAVAVRYRSTVSAVLALLRSTCLVRSAVLRRWDGAHDRPRELVVGVARQPDGAIAAHAWLDGERSAEGFVELYRRPPA